METVTVVYHFEDGLWWAEAAAAPEFTAGADTFEEARKLTHEGLALLRGCEVELDERFDEAAMAARRSNMTASSSPSVSIYLGSGSFTPAAERPAHAVPDSLRARTGSVASSAA